MTKDILKKYKFKLFIRKNSKYLIGILLLLIGSLVGVYFSYSRFSVKQETEVVRTVVGDFISGDVVLAYSIDGVKGSDAFPKQNTGYEGVSVTCDNEATAEWDNTIWSIKMTNPGNGKRVKCNVDFKSQETKTISGITFKLNTFSPDFSKSACSTCESTESGVFTAEDDYGISYYYRGSVEDNYVSFANKTWRIVRINGDGSVRIILNDTIDSEVLFNNTASDNAYIGYMYGTSGSSTYAETHSNKNDSVLKQNIDTWYENNLNSYSKSLADNGFCNDRSVLENVTNYGTGTMSSHYNGYVRVTASLPSLKCTNTNDIFTTSSSNDGNKSLKYPIATITADEVIMAGSSGGMFDGDWNKTKASKNYLNTGKKYWTMTPVGAFVPLGVNVWVAGVFRVGDYGNLDDYWLYQSQGARPVVNLRSDAIKSGTGIVSDPYTVV